MKTAEVAVRGKWVLRGRRGAKNIRKKPKSTGFLRGFLVWRKETLCLSGSWELRWVRCLGSVTDSRIMVADGCARQRPD